MKKEIIKFIITFIVVTVLVTSYFVFAFKDLSQSINFKSILDTMKRFSFLIALPTSLLFLFVDYFITKKITTKIKANVLRAATLLILTYLVSLLFSGYIIFNSLLDNPFYES